MGDTPQNTEPKRLADAFEAQKGKGRPKGALNKTTIIAKDAIAHAFEALGGVDALVEWARLNDDNKRVFYGTIYPKLLPLQVTGEGGGPVAIDIRRTIQDPQADL